MIRRSFFARSAAAVGAVFGVRSARALEPRVFDVPTSYVFRSAAVVEVEQLPGGGAVVRWCEPGPGGEVVYRRLSADSLRLRLSAVSPRPRVAPSYGSGSLEWWGDGERNNWCGYGSEEALEREAATMVGGG